MEIPQKINFSYEHTQSNWRISLLKEKRPQCQANPMDEIYAWHQQIVNNTVFNRLSDNCG